MLRSLDNSPTEPDAGFDGFYAAQIDRAIRLAHLLTGSRAAGQDIAHDAFIAIHGKWPTIDNPPAYLRSTVVNLCRSSQRRLIRERLHLRRFGVADVTTGLDELDDTWALICRLPAAQRAVVVLRFYEDLPLATIADLLDKPLGTVKSELHRALARLKESLR